MQIYRKIKIIMKEKYYKTLKVIIIIIQDQYIFYMY